MFLLDFFHLNEIENKQVKTLSGGQKQRIILARALYQSPAILFMDEATSNLDVSTESKISNNIRQLGMTRIFVSHRSIIDN